MAELATAPPSGGAVAPQPASRHNDANSQARHERIVVRVAEPRGTPAVLPGLPISPFLLYPGARLCLYKRGRTVLTSELGRQDTRMPRVRRGFYFQRR